MLTDPYRPPTAAVVEAEPRERKLYTLNQIALATFVGSVAAGCFLVSRNLVALGRPATGWRTFASGVAAELALIGIRLLLPSIPGLGLGINVASLVVLRSIAQDLHGDALRERVEQGARLHSTWWVLLLSVLFLLLYGLAILVAAVFTALVDG
jgi:hypothetical protein